MKLAAILHLLHGSFLFLMHCCSHGLMGIYLPPFGRLIYSCYLLFNKQKKLVDTWMVAMYIATQTGFHFYLDWKRACIQTRNVLYSTLRVCYSYFLYLTTAIPKEYTGRYINVNLFSSFPLSSSSLPLLSLSVYIATMHSYCFRICIHAATAVIM